MYYRVEFTRPTLKFENIDDYKDRVIEIVKGQIGELVRPYRFLNPVFWIFCIFYIPFSFIYAALSIVELLADTILLPFHLIPYVRVIPMFISIIIWAATLSIGVFSCVNLQYDVNEPIWFYNQDKKEKKPTKKQLKAIENIKEINKEQILETSVSAIKDLFVNYNLGDVFARKKDVISSAILALFNEEEQQQPNLFLPNGNRTNISQKTLSIGVYYLLDFEEYFKNYNRPTILQELDSIITEELTKENSIFGYDSIIPIKNYCKKRIKLLFDK